ncbi:MAG TPA: hypothetical protein VHP58_02490 [Alphaproteobacteria bacterium]|nr:hypothetical protein [Alphaproteobacteria bacterium]
MWTDYYLKFETRDGMLAVLPEPLKISLEGGSLTTADAGPDFALDDVGTLYNLAGEAVSGYHANLRLAVTATLPEALMPYVLAVPAHPKRVWA